MRYYIVAGEKSGDLHASNLMKELKAQDPEATFKGIGGDRMIGQGLVHLYHITDTAMMMIVDVIKHLRRIAKIMSHAKKDIVDWQPDVVILVDYGGFNLRLAKFTKKQGFTTFYYIAPKVWAWNQKRALKIKASVDRVFSIIHFEKAFYKKWGFTALDYVGNPVCDATKAFVPDEGFALRHGLAGRQVIAVLPGSRKSEVSNMLSIMLEVKDRFATYEFVVAGVDELDDRAYRLAQDAGVKVIKGETYDLLHISQAALVTSGTATLETAMLKVPQVVCYKMGQLTYLIIRPLVKVQWISLVNLLNGKETVRELIQSDLNADQLTKELNLILGEGRQQMLNEYDVLEEKITTQGASKETARLMYDYLTHGLPASV